MPSHRQLVERRYFSLGESLIDASIGFAFGVTVSMIAVLITLWATAQ